MDNVQDSRRTISTPFGWFVWGIAALFYAIEFTHRVAPSVMIPHLMEGFDVQHASIGHMASFYFYAYALFQVPAGVLCDRFGVRIILTMASMVVALGSFLFSASTNFELACIARFLIGAGSAFGFVSCLKIASLWIHERLFPLLVGLTNVFGMVGAILGGKPLAGVLQILTWEEVYWAFGFIGMILSGLIFLIVRRPQDYRMPTEPDSHPMAEGFKYVVKTPQAWVLGLYGALLVAPITAFAELWGVEYFKSCYGIDSTSAASLMIYIFVGIGIGGPTIGLLSNVSSKIKLWMMLGCLITIGALMSILYVDFNRIAPGVSAWLPFQLSGLTLLKVTLFVYGFTTSHMLLCFSIANRTFPKWANGAAIGFVNMMVMGCSAIFQPVIGKLIDMHFGQLSVLPTELALNDYRYALSILPVGLLIALGLLLWLNTGHHKKKHEEI